MHDQILHTPDIHTQIIDQILHALAIDTTIYTKEQFHRMKNPILAQYAVSTSPTTVEMLDRYRKLCIAGTMTEDIRVMKILRKRAVRSLSGVAVISLLTKFWGCPGKCIYCPTYDNLPKSYITGEPAVQRAEMNNFDPTKQVQNRLQSLEMTGNAIAKCDVRIIGGTWSVYPHAYQEEFVKNIYDAHTNYTELRKYLSLNKSTQYIDSSNTQEQENEEGRMKNEEYVQKGVDIAGLSPPERGLGGLESPVIGTEDIDISQIQEIRGGEDFSKGTYIQVSDGEKYDANKEVRSIGEISPGYATFHIADGYIPYISTTLEEAKKRNETAECRVVGMAIETRPDWITPEEIVRLRTYGVTRVEIGYQTTDDRVNELSKRGHGNTESTYATRLLKDAGFKVVAHMMPGLVGADIAGDQVSMARVWSDPDFRPDEIKIYPMVVTPHSELEDIWRDGKFIPYTDQVLVPLVAQLQEMLPEYVRLLRTYRDIPADQILAGSKLANLRQITEAYMLAHGMRRRDISAREIRARGNDPHTAVMDIQEYDASGGREYFLQYIDPVDRTIFSLCRLRIVDGKEGSGIRDQELEGYNEHVSLSSRDGSEISSYPIQSPIITHSSQFPNTYAIIRELHTYGDQMRVGQVSDGSGQHMGFGKNLLQKAEEIVKSTYPDIQKIYIISGIGAREYYRKRGYVLEDEYMVKELYTGK